MCTIAGYIGRRDAAPILIEMLKREEGFDSGFYTGIATVHEGKIYFAKTVGDVARLLETTDALKLPGKIGFIHSRTKGGKNCGGSREWSHPFVSERDGEVYLAHVANGGAGFFKDTSDRNFNIANELIAKGYTMRTREQTPVQMHVGMKDGTSIHISDLVEQYAAMLFDSGMELADAAEAVHSVIPMEDVDLYISAKDEKRIAFAKANQPMTVGYAEDGVYMATTPMAFPEHVGEPILLPSFTSGYVSESGITLRPFKKPTATVTPLDTHTLTKAYGIIETALKAEKQTVDSLRKIIMPEIENADITPTSFIVYEALRAMKKDGILKFETVRIPGREEGLSAPETRWWI